MKKKDIVNLIRCHVEKNDAGFRAEAVTIAKDFEAAGDHQLAAYVMSLISGTDVFVPQEDEQDIPYLEKAPDRNEMLLLPDAITNDILGIVHSIKRRIGVNKFLFKGAPGTGKTVAVQQLARILDRELYIVDSSSLIDSKLGQTQKNIVTLFKAIGRIPYPEKILILFDEIDSIALDRTNPNDLREMGRATTAILKGFDALNENVIVVGTTNLFAYFDKALTRRFDFIVDFDRYSQDDLLEIAEKMLDRYLDKFKLANHDIRLFRKVLGLLNPIPLPGELQNLIKTSVAFSDPEDGMDYFRRLYISICHGKDFDAKALQEKGFTVREIGILTQKSKSGVGRELHAK